MVDLKSLVERVLTPVGSSGSNIVYRCPLCERNSGSGHLYIDYNKGYFHCVKCNYGGKNLLKLLNLLGVDSSLDYSMIESSTKDNLDTVFELEKKVNVKKLDYSRNLKNLKYYYDYHTKDLSIKAKQYLYNRNITDDFIKFFDIREGINCYKKEIYFDNFKFLGRDYSSRIMVPSLRKDNLISFYIGRDYSFLKQPRYLNPPNDLAYSSEDVWSLDIIDSNYVVICEGVFTALSVDIACGFPVAVATYGKSIASKSNYESSVFSISSQGEKLLSKKFDTYYVFYDFDVDINEKINTCKYLFDRGAHVKVVDIDKSLSNKYGCKVDAGDMTKEEVLYCLRNAKEFTKFYGTI